MNKRPTSPVLWERYYALCSVSGMQLVYEWCGVAGWRLVERS